MGAGGQVGCSEVRRFWLSSLPRLQDSPASSLLWLSGPQFPHRKLKYHPDWAGCLPRPGVYVTSLVAEPVLPLGVPLVPCRPSRGQTTRPGVGKGLRSGRWVRLRLPPQGLPLMPSTLHVPSANSLRGTEAGWLTGQMEPQPPGAYGQVGKKNPSISFKS